jgi:type V secretory pathway adhesin AidA
VRRSSRSIFCGPFRVAARVSAFSAVACGSECSLATTAAATHDARSTLFCRLRIPAWFSPSAVVGQWWEAIRRRQREQQSTLLLDIVTAEQSVDAQSAGKRRRGATLPSERVVWSNLTTAVDSWRLPEQMAASLSRCDSLQWALGMKQGLTETRRKCGTAGVFLVSSGP